MLRTELWTAVWCEKREKLTNAICGKSLNFVKFMQGNKWVMDINVGDDILGIYVQKCLHNMCLILNG